jgi:hypothetical protein
MTGGTGEMTGPVRGPAAGRRRRAVRTAGLPTNAAVTPDGGRTTLTGGVPTASGRPDSPAGDSGPKASGGLIASGGPIARHGLMAGGGQMISALAIRSARLLPGGPPDHGALAVSGFRAARAGGTRAARGARVIRGGRRSLWPPGRSFGGAARPAG